MGPRKHAPYKHARKTWEPMKISHKLQVIKVCIVVRQHPSSNRANIWEMKMFCALQNIAKMYEWKTYEAVKIISK